MNNYSSEEEYKSDSDIIKEFTIEDFLNNPETENILETNFFEKVKEVEYANESFMNIFDKDKDGKMSYDFFLTIYPFIAKSYDVSIFEKFPFLANSRGVTQLPSTGPEAIYSLFDHPPSPPVVVRYKFPPYCVIP